MSLINNAHVDKTVVVKRGFNSEQSTFAECLAHSSSYKEITNWLDACPDKAAFFQALREHVFRNTKSECSACGEENLNGDMRYDEANPCGDPSTLICEDCWSQYHSGLWGDPDYRPPEWPANLQLRAAPKTLVDGYIWSKSQNKCVGTVQGYNAKGHFANMVTLGFDSECAEGGSLDPDHIVVDDLELQRLCNSNRCDTIPSKACI